MTEPTTRYRKKPIEIEARQLLGSDDGEPAREIARWCGGWLGSTFREPKLVIPTLEGDMVARPGDWVVRGVKGEFYPVRADIFAETYAPAVSSPLPDQTAGPICKFDEGCHRVVPCEPGCGTPLPDQTLRDRIASAVQDGPTWMLPRSLAEQIAAAVLAVLPTPADRAAEEAYRLALSTALRLGTGANWEAIRDRAEDLVAEVEELTAAKRRLLDQRRPDTDQTAESAPATGHNDSAGDVRPAAIAWDFEGEYEADRWHGIGHTYRNGEHDQALAYLKRRAETDKEHRRIRMVRAATTYTVEAECIPAAAQQPKEA